MSEQTPEPTKEVVPAAPATPAVPAPRPVKSSEEYFNSSRLRVIGLITAATLAVGALGGIAGVVFDPDQVGKDHIVQPGNGAGASTLGPQSLAPLAGVGKAAPHARGAVSSYTSRLPGSDSTASPSVVGSISPSTGGFSDSASPTPTEEPSPTEEVTPPSDGSGPTIESTGVKVYVPPGWHVDFQDENRVFQSNDDGSYSFAFSYADDPSTNAGDVITQNLDNMLPTENYTQRQTSNVVQLDPFGSVVSLAGIEYEALWVDNQGSATIHGQIYVGVRQDGTVLGVLIEHIPADEFESSFPELAQILDGTFNPFGGVG